MAQDIVSGVTYVMLGVSEIDRSVRFYEQTLGRKVLFSAGDSLVFVDGGPIMIGLNAALGTRRKPIAGATEIVFRVDSVTASHRALVERAAVCVTEPRPVTDKDWAATFADPDGHYLTLFGPE